MKKMPRVDAPIASVIPPHMDKWHPPSHQPTEEHDDTPPSRSAEYERSAQPDNQDDRGNGRRSALVEPKDEVTGQVKCHEHD